MEHVTGEPLAGLAGIRLGSPDDPNFRHSALVQKRLNAQRLLHPFFVQRKSATSAHRETPITDDYYGDHLCRQ